MKPIRLERIAYKIVIFIWIVANTTGCTTELSGAPTPVPTPTRSTIVDSNSTTAVDPVTQLIPAFPGAEGFGSLSVGGRGGKVIEVTNLDDAGPGSLRAAVEVEGPRIVVFRVAGTIELQSGLVVAEPFITISGQTAPG